MDKAKKEAELRRKEELAKKKIKKEEFEDVIEYFYEEGINEEGIDLLIEEIGLEEFVNFVDGGGAVDLNEERAARRASVRAKSYEKVKAEVDKADAAKKKAKKGEYAPSYAKKETDVTVYDDKPAKKKAVGPVKQMAKRRADDNLAGAPLQKKPSAKKVAKAVAKVKKVQPKKPASKQGLRDKITTAYKAGVKRHKKAVQPARVFAKGMKAGAKKTVKFAKDVKKAVVGEAKVDTGSAEAKASARNVRNTPPGKDSKFDTSVFITRKPGESLDSARTRKRRDAHAAKRGVKEDKAFDNVVRALRKKHGKDAVITKDNPPKPPTEAQKKEYAAHKAKIAAQDTRDDLEKSSSGRYSRKYSNVGSD